MTSNEIRSAFLRFFEERGHRVVPSSPVVPQNDPTLLFTNAGMNQFKDVFLGREKRGYARAASSQKCIRAGGKHNDLEQVGHTARHQTFFEMLGNFSFGDYFKREAIAYAWEFLTKVVALPPTRLWITIHTSDDEAATIWKDVTGFGWDRIIRLGDEDNFWQMGDTGPCGPCTEIHFDRGERFGAAAFPSDRYMEIWNNVFMQFDRQPGGALVPLPKPSVDTGMGLERLSSVLQDVETTFETDLLRPLIEEVAKISGRPYDRGESGVSHRVIADHVRTLTFAFADGALPSNEGRGYVLRRILRRAARYGRKLELHEAFIHGLVPTLVGMMGGAYPEIRERADHVARLIRSEEDSFNRTLDRGLELFEQAARRVIETDHSDVFPGDVAFDLYHTYGFPEDLTRILAMERHLGFDEGAFKQRLAEEQARSRAASKFEAIDLRVHGDSLKETRFLGYSGTEADAEVLSFSPERGEMILDRTPFYAESGGQVGDTGTIEARDGSFRFDVRDTKKTGGVIVHFGPLGAGAPAAVKAGAPVRARADADRRIRIMKNHTATHLLHWALQRTLGAHAKQQGSVVEPDRLRFDFSHFEAVKPEQVEEIERAVNRAVFDNHEVAKYERSLDEAKRAGVTALFGEKYGDRVRVVDIAGFSRELCGGTHVERTGDIGPFKVVQETAVQAGVRRVVALTGPAAVDWMLESSRRLREIGRELSAPEEKIVERVRQLQASVKDLKQQAKKAGAGSGTGTGTGTTVKEERIGDVRLVLEKREGGSADDLRARWDSLKEKGPVAAVLLAAADGKVSLVAGASKDVAGPGFKAAVESAAKAAGGRAGGKLDMIQGGLPGPDRVDAFLTEVEKALRAALTRPAEPV